MKHIFTCLYKSDVAAKLVYTTNSNICDIILTYGLQISRSNSFQSKIFSHIDSHPFQVYECGMYGR